MILIALAGVAAGAINAIVGSGTLVTFPTLVALGYPPVRHLSSLVASGSEPEAPERLLRELKRELEGADLLGPAPLLRLRGRHRAQLVAKTDSPRALASAAGRVLGAAAPAMRRAGVTAVVDVDPQSL